MRILDFNHCNIPECKCGWNVFIGGIDDKELRRLRSAINKISSIDETDYSKKIHQEKFYINEED